MTNERPLELDHLRVRLHADFDARLPAGQGNTPEERESNFLTHALAAFAVHKLASSSLDDAANSLVDGGGDFGIDEIYYSPTDATLWIIQSKFDNSGRGQVDLGEVSKFCDGVSALLSGNFRPFSSSAKILAREHEIRGYLRIGGMRVCSILVYSGSAILSQDRHDLFDRLRCQFASDPDYLSINSFNLTSVHDWVTGADDSPGVSNVEITISDTGRVQDPYETVYGRVAISQLAALWQTHGKRLVAANLRAYKGSTAVNDGIYSTIAEEPENFFYVNNGLTAYCQRMELDNIDRPVDRNPKHYTLHGFSIVNGAQTLGSIAKYADQNDGNLPDGYVFVKIMSLHGCSDEQKFAAKVTQRTNFQNRITPRDFAALEEEHRGIALGLEPSGIYYHYKDSDDNPEPDENNFLLDEATTALASLEQQSACDLLSRIVAQRKALWSFEEVYQPSEVHRSRYAKIFKTIRSARSIWRAVQTQRLVVSALDTSERGVRRAFFTYGRWLVLNLIFLKLHPHFGESLALTPAEEQEIRAKAQEFIEIIWNICREKGFVSLNEAGGWDSPRHARSVFSSASDCEILRNAVLARIAQGAQSPAPATGSPQTQTTPSTT